MASDQYCDMAHQPEKILSMKKQNDLWFDTQSGKAQKTIYKDVNQTCEH